MKEAAELLSGAPPRLGPAHLAERWDSLPDPVRRYLRLAIPDSARAPEITTVHVTHSGNFRTSPKGRWLQVQAEEYHTAAEPGFVWCARFRPMPLVTLTVIDTLHNGRGRGRIHAVGRVPVATLEGPEVDQSASARWLMEAVWFPFAFVGPHVRWEPIDATSARAILTTIPDVIVTLRFDRTTGLPHTVEGDRHMTRTRRPFRGTYSDFHLHSGVLIPASLQGSWILPEGEFHYVDFQLQSIQYNPPLPDG